MQPVGSETHRDEPNPFYPDLVGKGLVRCVQDVLNEIGSKLVVRSLEINVPFPAYARVESGSRFSQIYVAAKERLFLPDFWNRGVYLATGQTPDLQSLAAAIELWNGTEASLDELAGHFHWVKLCPDAMAYEQGMEVDRRWRNYLASIKNDIPELESFVLAAASQPQLRQLFPVTSLNSFGFSRCTGYPFTSDTPSVRPTRDGRYQVFDRRGKRIGVGNADEAVQIVVANLPPGCGPAIPGTADDIRKRSRN